MTAILAKVGLAGVDSDFATVLRTIAIVLIRAPFVWLSAVATGASWGGYFRALQWGRASQVAPVDTLSVPLVAVLASLLLGERPAPWDWRRC